MKDSFNSFLPRPPGAPSLNIGTIPRMHRVFAKLSRFSLVLCVSIGAIWLWCTSHFIEIEFWRVPLKSELLINGDAPDRMLRLYIGHSRVALEWICEEQIYFVEKGGRWVDLADSRIPKHWTVRAGDVPIDHFVSGSPRLSYSGSTDVNFAEYVGILRVPLWILLCSALVLPITYVTMRYFRRQDRENLCCSCGYDLRATSDRCPECGRKSRRAIIRNPRRFRS